MIVRKNATMFYIVMAKKTRGKTQRFDHTSMADETIWHLFERKSSCVDITFKNILKELFVLSLKLTSR